MMLCGIGAARGIAIASAFVHVTPPVMHLPRCAGTRAEELGRLQTALARIRTELHDACDRAGAWPAEVQSILQSQRELVDDPHFAANAASLIDVQACTAEDAIAAQRDEVAAAMNRGDADPYLRARRHELDGLYGRLLSMLARADDQDDVAPATATRLHADDEYILVCADPSPADLLTPRSGRMTGLVSERGGQLSHTTIVARSLRLPYVAGLANVTSLLRDGDPLIVDGNAGLLLTYPDDATVKLFRDRQRSQERYWQRIGSAPTPGPARSADAFPVEILSNVRGPADLTLSRRLQVDGVGLYRTEFLFANRDDLPSEDEHYESYRSLCQGMGGAPVTIRTLDASAGTQLRGLETSQSVSGQPALGLRAIRLCLQYPEVFKPQLRALLRAAVHGPVRILLPLVTTVGELDATLAMIGQCREELTARGVAHADDVPVGVMVEVPSAALCASALARRAAFLSIGTNDLIQYTLAIDREDESVQSLYDALNPGVLRLILATLAAGRRSGVPVSLCGELAGDPRYTRLLLGLGLTSFSMGPINVPEVRRAIMHTRIHRVRHLARQIVTAESVEQACELLEQLNALDPPLDAL
jgi:phosphotransferase system enzyme I (PtsI)